MYISRSMYRGALLIGMGLIAETCWAGPQTDLYRRVDASVVCIESAFGKAGDRVLGSGFFVTPELIVTASHLVHEAETVLIYTRDKAKHPATLLASDNSNDVAILRADGVKSGNYLSLKSTQPELGDAVFTIGCPFGLEHSLTQGVVSHVRRQIEGHSLVQVDLSVNQGNSGGPLVSKTGYVLGTIYGFLLDSHGAINFAIPIDETLLVAQRHEAIAKSIQDADDLSLLWRQANADNNPQRKIAKYTHLIEQAPWMLAAYYNRANAYHEVGDYVASIEDHNHVIRHNPKYYRAYVNRGMAYYRLGEHSQAKHSLIEAIEINPDYSPAFLNLGIVYARGLADQNSAALAFERFLALVPEGGEALEVAGWLVGYRDSGVFEFEEAAP